MNTTVGNPIVLILCTGNSCRSQMAEGFLRHVQPDKFEPHSAGTQPQTEVHLAAVKVMAEVGKVWVPKVEGRR